MERKRILVRIFLYILCVLSIFLILYNSGVKLSDLSPEMILKIANNNTLIILIIMLVIMTVQNLFTFFPIILVISVNIAIFGFWKGYLFSAFSSIVGSTLIFFSIRYLFPNVFTSTKLEKYKEKVEKNGFLFVLTARLIPILPTNITNIVSGLSTIKASHFLLATIIGYSIDTLLLASASFSVIALIKHHPIYTVMALIFLVIVFFIIQKLRKQRRVKVL